MLQEASETKSLRVLTRQVPPHSVVCAPDRCQSNDTRFEDYDPQPIQDYSVPAERKLPATEPAARSPHSRSAFQSAARVWKAAPAWPAAKQQTPRQRV